ncbi:plexin-like protein [Euroglyphus maynei]|uniref:Plexin-like protein n=1 Tax=Euroglyphus maynei TaxID=6958 RepID=A0A1Y3AQV7_EURMA|nr:plexin-like protein [Euroglyphus maynei]
MQSLNMAHVGQFDTVCALKELFVYAVKYHADIMNNLQQSDYLTKQQSLEKFINLINYKF